jgi:hypothetical protein
VGEETVKPSKPPPRFTKGGAVMLRFIFRVPRVIARAGAILWNRY